MNYSFPLVSNISSALNEKIKEFTFHHSFSSSKDELFLNFKKGSSEFGIRLLWAHRHCYLFFQEKYFAAPTPHYKQFVELNDKKIISLKQHSFNRSFQINFEDDLALVFKLYDGLSNVILFEKEKFVSHYRIHVLNDTKLKLSDFDKPQSFVKPGDDEEPGIRDILESMTKINRNEVSESEFHTLQSKLLSERNTLMKKLQKDLAQTEKALEEINQAVPENLIAHLILSNLTLIKQGQESVELFDYAAQKTVTVKLKKDLLPQQNAEYYFSKFKSRSEKIKELERKSGSLKLVLSQIENQGPEIEKIKLLKELQRFEKQKTQSAAPLKLFREFEFEGFKILVGKNAANNDLLTMKHAHKNDLWLHVKDGGGSHVVVKHISGKPFTKKVMEYAASVAVAYSRSKSSSVVPVVYTEKKFVRKPKGAKPGEVVIEKEKVILADSKIF
ncbi:MAG: NFACT RNA binding domain-containing protein [Bacteroidia bacterium]